MSTPTITRQPKGIPVGGQFAEHDRADADITLPADTDDGGVFRRRYDSVEDKVKAFMAELDDAVASIRTDADWLHYLDVMSRFHTYSFNNQMLIAIQRPDATRVAGFKKWQELGRQVRKGERGIAIMAPRTARIKLEDANGKPILDGNGKQRVENRVVGVTTATVFDVSQTDGKDLPVNHAMTLSVDPPEGFIEDLEKAVADAGFTVSYEKGIAGGGYTTAQGNRVVVKAGMSRGEIARTLAHELGHIHAGHLDRMDEYHSGIGGCRGQMEVEADSISYAVMRANGMDPSIARSNASYVAGWTKDSAAVKSAGVAVAKGVKAILGGTTFRNVG